MCRTCGCSDPVGSQVINLQNGVITPVPTEPLMVAVHDHGHPHEHDHTHRVEVVHIEQALLARNHAQAERNRGWFAGRDILALNLVSAPGSGKTTLLERTIRDLSTEFAIAVIEGDQATARDAERIRQAGTPTVQINTGAGCHLDAALVARGLQQLQPTSASIVFIENVGNLVCPALFDLGERTKVLVASVTEGDDKPLKYPHMFRACGLIVLNKVDLLPYVPFAVERFVANARQVNPEVQIIQLSVLAEAGLTEWYQWLRHQHATAANSLVLR